MLSSTSIGAHENHWRNFFDPQRLKKKDSKIYTNSTYESHFFMLFYFFFRGSCESARALTPEGEKDTALRTDRMSGPRYSAPTREGNWQADLFEADVAVRDFS